MNAGLEPFAGFLHVDRPGKPSLVLDLVEEFRQPVVDRAVIAAIAGGRRSKPARDADRFCRQAVARRCSSGWKARSGSGAGATSSSR